MFVVILLASTFATTVSAQLVSTVAVMSIDVSGIITDGESMGNLMRLELQKTGYFRVMSKYDMIDIAKEKQINLDECFGITCIIEAGKAFQVEKIVTGSVQRYGEKLVISVRLINVNTGIVERTDVQEFLNMESEIQTMISISLKSLLGLPIDDLQYQELKYYSAPVIGNNTRLALNGPRMGLAYVTGDLGKGLTEPLEQGGYDGYPILSQFGYQHEVQYLTAGNFQALFEFLFMVSGLDQGMFIPSLTVMNGFRDNRSSFEFAFGPSLALARVGPGFVDKEGILPGDEGQFYLLHEWYAVDTLGMPIPNPNPIEVRLSKRARVRLNSGWVWAVGKTFKSGHLNIPVNAYVSPSKHGWYVGMSVGFNIGGRKYN